MSAWSPEICEKCYSFMTEDEIFDDYVHFVCSECGNTRDVDIRYIYPTLEEVLEDEEEERQIYEKIEKERKRRR